jgi:hypothetical protein
VLQPNKLDSANTIYKNQLAYQLGGKLSRDTIFRYVRFTADSNEHLSQAPYGNFLTFLKKGMLEGHFPAYNSPQLTTKLSVSQLQNICVQWDTTNQVEDPNSPGIFILSPLKYEPSVKTLLIYEKWKPLVSLPKAQPPVRDDAFWRGEYAANPPDPYLGYVRNVAAYGLVLGDGSTVWFSPGDINLAMAQSNYDFIPYQECFRSERFRTLSLQVHTR